MISPASVAPEPAYPRAFMTEDKPRSRRTLLGAIILGGAVVIAFYHFDFASILLNPILGQREPPTDVAVGPDGGAPPDVDVPDRGETTGGSENGDTPATDGSTDTPPPDTSRDPRQLSLQYREALSFTLTDLLGR